MRDDVRTGVLTTRIIQIEINNENVPATTITIYIHIDKGFSFYMRTSISNIITDSSKNFNKLLSVV